jgi:hypothetical protein
MTIIISADDNYIIISSSRQHPKYKIGVQDFPGTVSNKKTIAAKDLNSKNFSWKF